MKMQGDFFLLAFKPTQQELDLFISVRLEVNFHWLYISHLKLHRQYSINTSFYRVSQSVMRGANPCMFHFKWEA